MDVTPLDSKWRLRRRRAWVACCTALLATAAYGGWKFGEVPKVRSTGVQTTTSASPPTTSAPTVQTLGGRSDVLDETTTTNSPTSTSTAPNSSAFAGTVPSNAARGSNPMADIDEAKALFVRLVTASCTKGRVPDPNGATVQRHKSNVYRVIDAAQTIVMLDTSTSTVYSVGGPADILPAEYSFDCDPTVFLGTADG